MFTAHYRHMRPNVSTQYNLSETYSALQNFIYPVDTKLTSNS